MTPRGWRRGRHEWTPGALLARERCRHGWTQQQLARAAGGYLTPADIGAIERGGIANPALVIDLLILVSAPFSVLAAAHRLANPIPA